jgi:hypothetical protein
MQSILRKTMLCLSMLLLPACASTIKFESVPKAQLTMHTWKDLEGAGKPLGETPLEIEAGKLDGSIVKMAAPGRRPQFFAFPGGAQGTLRLKINLAESKGEGVTAGTKDQDISLRRVNQVNRKLLAIFQALIDKDYKSADALAAGVAQNEPELAAPRILQGLAKLYGGDRDGARTSFKSAQSIDPDDAALVEMLKVLK